MITDKELSEIIDTKKEDTPLDFRAYYHYVVDGRWRFMAPDRMKAILVRLKTKSFVHDLQAGKIDAILKEMVTTYY